MRTAARSAAHSSASRSGVAARARSQAQELLELRRAARVGVVAALLAPVELVEHGPVLCPFRRATGQPCPSCGLTRSWTAVAHGRLRDGFRFHPLGPPAFVVAAALSLVPTRWLERLPPYPPAVLPAFAFAWVGVWLARLIVGVSLHADAQEDVHDK
jgi:hypothetical protein